MCYANQNLLDRPMELNIWRAPTDNDRNIKNTWMRAQYDRTVTRAYETTAKEKTAAWRSRQAIRFRLRLCSGSLQV